MRKFGTKERVNVIDQLGNQTPLYYAAKKGHVEMCRLLVEKGVDTHHVDSSHKTALDYARKLKNSEIVELLSGEAKRQKEVSKFVNASQSIDESNLDKKRRKDDSKPTKITYKIVSMNEKGEVHDLTEEQVRELLKDKPDFEAYLCNPDSIPV